jgi:hypothetical protein
MAASLQDRYRGFLVQSFVVAFTLGALLFVILYGTSFAPLGLALLSGAVFFLIAMILAFVVSCLADEEVHARFVAWEESPSPPPAQPASVEISSTKQP